MRKSIIKKCEGELFSSPSRFFILPSRIYRIATTPLTIIIA